MSEARQRGYAVELIFVGIDNPQTNIERVSERVAAGGHYVPDDDVRRRYTRSMENLPRAVASADRVTVFDNSSIGRPIQVLLIKAEVISVLVNDIPLWVVTHLGTLLQRGQE